MNINQIVASSVALLVTVAACTNDASEDTRETFLAQCSGTYTCTSPKNEKSEGALKRSGADCMLDASLILDPSGKLYESAAREDAGYTWSIGANALDLCNGASCLHCAADAAPAASTAAAGGKCTGSAYRCSSLGPGECTQDGCSFIAHPGFNYSVTFECEGEADACSSYSSSGSCSLQKGCRWE